MLRPSPWPGHLALVSSACPSLPFLLLGPLGPTWLQDPSPSSSHPAFFCSCIYNPSLGSNLIFQTKISGYSVNTWILVIGITLTSMLVIVHSSKPIIGQNLECITHRLMRQHRKLGLSGKIQTLITVTGLGIPLYSLTNNFISQRNLTSSYKKSWSSFQE